MIKTGGYLKIGIAYILALKLSIIMGDKNSNNILGCDDLKWCEVSVLTAVSNFKIIKGYFKRCLILIQSRGAHLAVGEK